MDCKGDKLHIKKTYYYDAIIYDNNLIEKARGDRFEPTTVPSKNYKTWRTVLDLKTGFDCAENHGRIFDISDSTVRLPPLHINCRCTLEGMSIESFDRMMGCCL